MGLSVKVLAFAAPLLSSFLSTIVTASPLDIGEMPPEVRPVPKTSPSISIPPTTSVPLIAPPINPADVICFHAADPNNICPAIADSPGYCECNNDGKSYEVMGPTNPCEWTTLPATTSLDCVPPAARVKRAPTTSPVECTLTEQALAGGRNPLVTHKCSCNDGSKPTPVIFEEKYVCPAQVSAVVQKRSQYNGIELGGFT